MNSAPNRIVKKLLKRLAIFTTTLFLLTWLGVELFTRGVILGDSYVPILLAIPGFVFGVLWICAYTWEEKRPSPLLRLSASPPEPSASY